MAEGAAPRRPHGGSPYAGPVRPEPVPTGHDGSDLVRRRPRTVPPLTDRGEVARLVAVALIGAVSLAVSIAQQPDAPGLRWFADAALGVGALVLVRWRRVHPVAVSVLVVLASLVSTSVLGAVPLALVSLATTRRWQAISGVGVLFLASTVASDVVTRGVSQRVWADLVLAAAAYGTCVGFGAYLGSRRDLVAALQDRAAAAEREQAARVAQVQVAERTRIAREMHDVLAHRISLVAMHAGVLAFRRDLPPDEQAATAGVVRDNANLALVELREVLGVLRADTPSGAGGTSAPEPPQPTLSAVPELVERERRAGAVVRLDLDAATTTALADLPETTSRHAYRIAQEGLTNARKHAPGSLVHVTVEGSPGGLLTLTVQNAAGARPPAGLAGAGLGLVGAAERVRLLGGRLDHGPDDTGGYRLRAVLPWPHEE